MPVNSQTRTKLDKKSLVSRANGTSSLANLRSLVEALELESLTLTGDLVVTGSVTAGSIAGSNAFADGTAAAPSISNTGDTNTGIYFSAADQVAVTTGGVGQVIFADGAIQPVTDNDVDLGTSLLEFKDLYIDGTANIDALVADTADINGGTVDGTTIGATSASTGAFTTVSATGVTTLAGVVQAPVFVADATPYTILAANSGKMHIILEQTSSITLNLPVIAAGLSYKFVMGGVATEAQNWVIVATTPSFYNGGIAWTDLDDTESNLAVVYGNGSSHLTLTVTTPAAGTGIEIYSNGTEWFVHGTVISDSTPAFS